MHVSLKNENKLGVSKLLTGKSFVSMREAFFGGV